MLAMRIVLTAAAAAILLLPGAALAAHGKVGLWSVTTTMTMPGMPSAAVQSRTATHCMTLAEVKTDGSPATDNHDCKVVNLKVTGSTFTADMVCSGSLNGKGHLTTTYDGNKHYTGAMSYVGDDGMTFSNTFDGKWLKDDCKGATH